MIVAVLLLSWHGLARMTTFREYYYEEDGTLSPSVKIHGATRNPKARLGEPTKRKLKLRKIKTTENYKEIEG